mmetsp:Transcript_45205/g.105396  ORF Transcript_45205/g.105396 Transcript_45205/m.105396 type:complete len:1912 (+) Transcript_45205:101-5836(+)
MDDDAGGFDDNEFDDEDQASDAPDGDIPEIEGDEEAADDFDMDARVGHLSRADIADLSPQEQLQKWHEMLLFAEADLISELDASNIFFINAESIICDLYLSSEVNEDSQFLRMTFMVEQLLASIQSCGGVFRLIFFDAMKHVFSLRFEDSLWAFREAFLRHCQTIDIDHAVFPHWYSQEWRDHVATWRPSFFLLADDALAVEDDDEDEDEEEAAKGGMLRGSFQAMTLRCLSYKVHVALLKGLQRRGNRVMAFTLEPDNHDSFIDKNVQGALQPFLEEEDEDEDEEEPLAPQIVAFNNRASGKVQETALLRSFLLCRFCKNTLAQAENSDASGTALAGLMKLFVKSIMIQEMLLRYVPLDKRAFTTISNEDWEFFAEFIGGALDRFYTHLSEELGKINRGSQTELEGLKLDSCDLFDGRLFRHVFRFVVSAGLAEKSKEVKSDTFKFSSYIIEELDFLWSEASSASSKEKFFPLKLAPIKDMAGLQPPDLPAQAGARERPVLFKIESELFDAMWKEKADNLNQKDEDEPDDAGLLWERYNWKDKNEQKRVDAILEVQEMEKNEAEKRMEQKMREKKKITDKDREYERKFHMKKRQMAIRYLARYAKSLTGSDKLHLPIVSVKCDQKEEEDKKKKGEEKMSKKHQELLEKNKKQELEKTQAQDAKQLAEWDKPVDALAEASDVEKLEKDLLDLLIGYNRVVPSFVGFPALQSAFKTPEAQAKVIIKVVKNLRTALKKMQLDKLPETAQPKVTSLVVYVFCLVQEAWNSYGSKGLLDGKGIKLLQEMLISLGFRLNAQGMFKQWKEVQASAGKDDGAGEDGEKGKDGKDKKGKDAKDDKKADKKKDKEKDKKDKKESKDAKETKDDSASLDSFQVTKEVELCWSGVGSDEYAFQLMHMGPQMTRLVGTAKDARVNFKPDKWQRDLLDIVDANESALVVAPTASGKTFIGYYVMDQVLRNDHDGVAVYVAPSKALVNQVSAEIYARFGSKIYPAHSKQELLGVFLKEFNSAGGVFDAGKWKECQVLVTIPHILEMLLLSAGAQDWVSRLRYVVFDEVHCIGEQEGGVQWEHCMQLIPCPFIALSATVADPSFFHGWLGRVSEQKKLSEVHIVEHKERWNDLYKHVWYKGELRPLHPFCCLVESSLLRNGMSSDMSLVPREMVQLHQAVQKILGSNEKWNRLAPAKYFSGMAFVSKVAARGYEKELKETFLQLLHAGAFGSEGFSQLTMALQQPPSLGSFQPLPRAENEDEVDLTKLVKETSYLQASTLFKLCKDLDEKDIMPAIIFNFSRKEIERMLKKLVEELTRLQYDKYWGDQEAKIRTRKINDKRKAEYEEKKKAYDQAQKARASSKQEGNAARKSGEIEGRGGNKEATHVDMGDVLMQEPQEPKDISEEIDPEYTFHSARALGVWQEDIDEVIEGAKKGKCENWMIEGLRRGIGMHHEGLKKGYRDAVEILFRRGYLRVVFATGTLALGINMPCRSTIFCGDSLELTGLMFRQMSGRAGRRGFDLLGQVIFLDKPFTKIQRLISSDLSSLAGEFTLSPTILLRALFEFEEMKNLEEEGRLGRSLADITRCLAPVFETPFFQSKTAELKTQVAFHTRFTLELLYREGLMARDGSTRNLANLCTHLFEAEPANLVFCRLLCSGELHQYLADEAPKMMKGDRRTHLSVKLVSVLGWIFFRRRLPPSIPKERLPRKKHLPSEGCPRLPPLPPRIKKEIQRYNNQLFDIFQQFAWTVAMTRKHGETDLTLPTSSRSFPVGLDERGEPFDKKGGLGTALFKQVVKYKARSPFSALSGAGDFFLTPSDLSKNCRNVLHLDLNAIPTVACPPSGADANRELEATNSWILDFMIHGQRKFLWEDNGISATRAWKLIEEFVQILKKAVKAMKAWAPEDDIVLTTMTQLTKEMEAFHKKG